MTVPIFPDLSGLSFPIGRSPKFNNSRLAANWGRREVAPLRVLPTWNYDVSFSILRSEVGFLEFQQLLKVYLTTLGGALYFRFNDPDDNSVVLQPSGTGDGTSTAFELVRSQTGVDFAEPVRAFNGTPHIFVNGTEVFNWSIDAYGIVNFTGSYYWLCRFDEDQIPLSKFVAKWWECKGVKFSTDLLG
jgi:hypothetical protein